MLTWTEAPDAGPAAALDDVAGAFDVVALELLPWTPLLDLGGSVEGEIAAGCTSADRLAIGKLAMDGLGAELSDPFG